MLVSVYSLARPRRRVGSHLYLLFQKRLELPTHMCWRFSKTCRRIKKTSAKKLRYEKSFQKFHQSITSWFTTFLCEPSSITKDSPSFTKNSVVKLVNLGEPRQVSHGETINQVVMKRWNLWRLFSSSWKLAALQQLDCQSECRNW